jgi:predicted HicB family RNase H-like nuclease
MKMLAHKGYLGSACYSDEDGVFHGKIVFIRSLVNYEGTDINSLEDAFKEAVDDYIDLKKN